MLVKQENNYKRCLLIDTYNKNLNKIKTDNLKRELPINKLQVNNRYLCGLCLRCNMENILLSKNR